MNQCYTVIVKEKVVKKIWIGPLSFIQIINSHLNSGTQSLACICKIPLDVHWHITKQES